MNASTQKPAYFDDGSPSDEPIKYAPKKTRYPESDAPDSMAGDAQESAPAPPWRRSRSGSAATFAGDVAITELRTKLALAPERLPEPPPPSSSGSRLGWAGRIAGAAIVIAVCFIAYRWGASPGQLPQPVPSPNTEVAAATDRSAAATDLARSVPAVNFVPAVYPPPAKAVPGAGALRQLTIGPAPAPSVDEAVRLAISANEADANAFIVISGLAPGATLSAGKEMTPRTWRLSVEELPQASLAPPQGFAGVMDLTVELRLPDNSVADRKNLQLEWSSRSVATPPSRQHDAAEITQMMNKGAELMANGDVAAARLMYQRAAETGEAAAAFALAETYDPLVLAKGGIPPNVERARTWYAKARELGSSQAPERLERLAGAAGR
jgi:hypothetical protein